MKPVPADQRLLSPADLARLLGVSPRTVRRWAADGSLPAPVRKGTRYIRWRVADVQRFLGAHTDCAAPPLTPALRDFLVVLARRLAEQPAPAPDGPPGQASLNHRGTETQRRQKTRNNGMRRTPAESSLCFLIFGFLVSVSLWFKLFVPEAVMPGLRSYKITDKFVSTVCSFIRAGGFPFTAAEVAGVPAEVFRAWMRYGAGRSDNRLYRLLHESVREARAQARLTAEVTVFKADPRAWLREGPGRETPSVPGWSSPTRPVYRGEEASGPPDEQILAFCGELLRALEGDPQAHAAARAVLAEFAGPWGVSRP